MSRAASRPLLADDLVLLGHHPGTGKPLLSRTRLACGLAGSVLADLRTAGRIGLVDGRVVPAPGGSTGDEDLDALAAVIEQSRKTRTVRSWVSTLHSGRTYQRLTGHAVAMGVVRDEQARMLLVFTSRRHRPTRPADRQALVRQLRDAYTRSRAVDPRTGCLLALVAAIGLDRALADGLRGGDRRRLSREAVATDEIAGAVQRVIREIEAATTSA